MACLTHCIFNLQQDAIVAVCSSPSLHLSEMGMAPSTARCNRRCLLLAIMIIGVRDGVNIEKDDDDSDDRSL